jgi:hypothetical protein
MGNTPLVSDTRTRELENKCLTDILRLNNFRCIPVSSNKVPLCKGWNTDDYEQTTFKSDRIGLVCGSFSCGLEVIDVDTKVLAANVVEPFKVQLLELLKDDLHQLSVYETMSGGLHILYRCDNYAGNLKLSQPLDEWTEQPTKEALFETRGEGGFAVAYLDGHVAGNDYLSIKKISNDKRDELIELCRSLGKQPPKRKEVVATRKRKSNEYKYNGVDLISSIKECYSIEDVLSNEFTFSNPDSKGNVNVLRDGSKAAKSGTIFHNNKTGSSLYLHSTGTQYPANQMLDVIEILAIQNGVDESEIIKSFINQLNNK